MGQKVNPISNRLGIIRGWDSNWYGGNDYGDSLLEDSKIRKYLNARLAKASVSRIVIERTLKLVTITVCTARPGIIIGKGGQEVDKLKEELKKVTDKDIQIFRSVIEHIRNAPADETPGKLEQRIRKAKIIPDYEKFRFRGQLTVLAELGIMPNSYVKPLYDGFTPFAERCEINGKAAKIFVLI